MRDLLGPEAPFSIIVLLVCLPVAAGLIYVAGYSLLGMLSQPKDHPLLFAAAVAWLISLVHSIYSWVRKKFGNRRSAESAGL